MPLSLSAIFKPCLPRRRKHSSVIVCALSLVGILAMTFLIVEDLDRKQVLELPNRSVEKAWIEGAAVKQWERKPQSHLEANNEDRKNPKVAAIFNYNRAQVEEQLRRVTARVENIRQKLPLVKNNAGKEAIKDQNLGQLKEDYQDEKDYVYEELDDGDKSETDDNDNPNPIFKDGDFDNPHNLSFAKPGLKFEEENYVYKDPYDDIYQEENRKAREEENDLKVKNESDRHPSVAQRSIKQKEYLNGKDYGNGGLIDGVRSKVVNGQEPNLGVANHIPRAESSPNLPHLDRNLPHNLLANNPANPVIKKPDTRDRRNHTDIGLVSAKLDGNNVLDKKDIVISNPLGQIETQIPIQDGIGNFAGEPPATQIQQPGVGLGHSVQVRTEKGMPIVVDKVYWAKDVEDLIPAGISERDYQQYLYRLSTEPVVVMTRAGWNKCGRPKNHYVELENGTKMCARYRDPHTKFVYGEILSFYLSRMLGLDNVPLVVLNHVNSSSPLWQKVAPNIPAADWVEGTLIALIQWVDALNEPSRSRVTMPTLLMEAYESGVPLSWQHPSLINSTATDLTLLIQWTDMIVFDYITGHYDRVASMQDGAEHENKPSIMHENIRNLRQSSFTSKLWLFDNESGLLDAYELIYRSQNNKFARFHQQVLKTTCIFHENTIRKVTQLARLRDPVSAIFKYASEQEPLFKESEMETKSLKILRSEFSSRLKEVLAWIERCVKL